MSEPFRHVKLVLLDGVPRGKRKEFGHRLLEWFKRSGRHNLPWRKTRDPWFTLIAPLLLRKTTSEQVEKVYSSFISRFPNPAALAKASRTPVEELIRPLGMEHHRAMGLIDLARQLVRMHNGLVPSTIRHLEDLPMVGGYTAREVLCVAYGQDEPMLDRNMIRVIQRVFSVESVRRRAHTDPELWVFAKGLIPQGMGREFNYAIMDFAHTVCKAKLPLCHDCPMNDICDYGSSRRGNKGK